MKFKDMPYERPDFKTLGEEVESYAEDIQNAKAAAEVITACQKYLWISNYVSTQSNLCSIRNSIDTTDKYYEDEMAFFNENGPVFSNSCNKFNKALLASKFRKEVEERYSKQWLTQLELAAKAFDEKIIPDLVEEGNLVTEYSKVMAAVRVKFDGKELNLSQMGKYSNSSDREVRKSATLAIAAEMEKIEAKLDEIYDKLVKCRTNMARKMGYENYVDFGYLRLGRSDYNSKDVANYRKQVYDDYLPLAKKVIEDQKKRLGYDSLYSYDIPMFYTDGNPNHGKTKDELVKAAMEYYTKLSPETEEFFKHMVDDEMMDLEAKPGKQGGGYCTLIADYKTPFIFSNFNGTMGDVDVLTHEAGHAFEVWTASKYSDVSELWFPTLEACEIHSMSMEFFAHPYMDLFFGTDAAKYRYKHLAEAVTFIPYGVTVDEFQHFVYENPDATPADRKAKWHELEQKYTPWKNFDGISYYERGNFWQRQGHIFSTAFYYIDYTLAQVCAFQFLLLDRANHEAAWKKYYDLCKLGGSMSFLNLLKAVDLKNPFESGFLAGLTPELDKVLENLKL